MTSEAGGRAIGGMLRVDDKGRLIQPTPEEMRARSEALRAALERMAAIPNGPDEDDAEFFRAMDADRPERPLFEGLY